MITFDPAPSFEGWFNITALGTRQTCVPPLPTPRAPGMIRRTMPRNADHLPQSLDTLAGALRNLKISPADRVINDLQAVRFHATRSADNARPIVAIIGGTGTGKSTLINRLLGADLSAASYRRTHTAGAIVFLDAAPHLPANWLGLSATPVPALPARGEVDRLLRAEVDTPLLRDVTLVDTPDIDGEIVQHHQQADRVFRWCDAVVFLVTPEKYQMTELLPYYRLAARYGVPTKFVMNKADDAEAPRDYADLLQRQGIARADVYVLPRDDSTYAPPHERAMPSLRAAIGSTRLASAWPGASHAAEAGANTGLDRRVADLAGRVADQVIAPFRRQRTRVDRARAALASLAGGDGQSGGNVDVHPLTRQLQRRLQQKSVLYLMGPGRIVDRMRDLPAMLVRLPKSIWDLTRGNTPADARTGAAWTDVPDFHQALVDQFRSLQSRIDDALAAYDLADDGRPDAGAAAESGARVTLSHGAGAPRSAAALAHDTGAGDPVPPVAATTTATAAPAWKLPAERAGQIADEEIAKLKTWLETRWNGTPRDTAILQKLLNVIPGGKKLTQYSEAAPYLLTLACVAHGAVFGHLDLMILGGYTVATWLSERVSNEVSGRTRATNAALAERFEALAVEQIERARAWLDTRAPGTAELTAAEAALDGLR